MFRKIIKKSIYLWFADIFSKKKKQMKSKKKNGWQIKIFWIKNPQDHVAHVFSN